jgi:DNA-binding response OmpR family regulator
MKRILIIEDDEGIRESLMDILELSGYDVDSVNNGKEGFNRILESKPDLVVCDVNMPELNGFELLGAINQRLSKEVLPVFIFLTAKIENKDIRHGMNLGADDYVTKPFDHNELLGIIKMRLEKREKFLQSHAEGSATGSEAGGEQTITRVIDKSFNKIAIPSSDGLELIEFDKIVRCEADRAYCKFFLDGKTRMTVSKPLKEFEEILLAHNFLKVHKSHIVSLKHITKYVKGANGYLVMSDDTSIPVSSRKKEEVLLRLKQG